VVDRNIKFATKWGYFSTGRIISSEQATDLQDFMVKCDSNNVIEEKAIITCERKILRRIFGPKKEDGIWKIRTNKELTELYNNPDIEAERGSRRTTWLGHLIRMNQGQMVKKLFHGKPGGRVRTGRPRLRWLNDVDADLRTMCIKRWRLTAKDRMEWAGIVRDAKALQGP
jgi:hypothetical protein